MGMGSSPFTSRLGIQGRQLFEGCCGCRAVCWRVTQALTTGIGSIPETVIDIAQFFIEQNRIQSNTRN
jgi:hypothetical protein